jgi:uncharacterized membrane protein HdeD (DUF308 family)
MASYLYQNRGLIGLRGGLAVLFGLVAFLWPGVTALALVFLFAAYAVLDGILTIAGSVRNREGNDRWWLGMLEGMVDIAAGVIAFLFPGAAAIVAVFVIAVWAIITGLLEIAAAIRLRQEINNEWALGLTGLVSVVLGVIMVINPGAGLLGLVWAIGSYAIIFGALMIYLAVSAGRFAPSTESGTGARIYTK